MPSTMRILAGDCTTRFEGSREHTQRGYVVLVVKPDKTVLVHDADGYQPVAWLTRPDSLTVEHDDDAFGLTARDDEQVLRVHAHRVTGEATLPVSAAGTPVGTAPEGEGDGGGHDDAGAPLVRANGDVVNLDTGERYALPAGATVTDERCPDCGLPRMRVARGQPFELCIDYACDSLLDRVRERFDREWACPDCGSPLRVFRTRRGPILAGCTAYPDCETAFSIPAGEITGECPCGLPVFETPAGRRCLDGSCDRLGAAGGDGDTKAGPSEGDDGEDDAATTTDDDAAPPEPGDRAP
jgi:DNA topoisomerase-1